MKRAVAATVGIALLAGGARLAARYALREKVERYRTNHPCGGVAWRTESVTTRPPFSEQAHVTSASVLESEGGILADGVLDMRCDVLSGTVSVLVPEGVRVYDNASGELQGTLRVPEPPRFAAWSSDGARVAVAGARLWVGRVGVDGDASLLREAAGLIARSPAWLDARRVCWIVAAGRELAGECADVDADAARPPARFATASWDGDLQPWVGAWRGQPHLCGQGLAPEDLECRGLSPSGEGR